MHVCVSVCACVCVLFTAAFDRALLLFDTSGNETECEIGK